MILLRIFPICVPLAGAAFNPLTALLIVLCALLFKSNTALYSITLGIPTIIATLCWISETQTTRFARIAQFIFNVILPITCMIAFYLHPIGQQAFAYSLYWLIPPGIYALKYLQGGCRRQSRRSLGEDGGERWNPAKLLAKPGPTLIKIITPALRITFITHAVGSILWIYTIPTTPGYWTALIPIVALERLCLAGATAGVLFAIKAFEHVIVKITAKA